MVPTRFVSFLMSNRSVGKNESRVGKFDGQVGKKGGQVGKYDGHVGKIALQVGIGIFCACERRVSPIEKDYGYSQNQY